MIILIPLSMFIILQATFGVQYDKTHTGKEPVALNLNNNPGMGK